MGRLHTKIDNMVKVFRVRANTQKFQWLAPITNETDILNLTTYDCKSLKDVWKVSTWYVINSKQKNGNFYSLGIGGAFAFDKKVYDSELFSILEMSGEILSIKVGGIDLYILNVLECINALDEFKTSWDLYPDGQRGRILKYVFHPDRFIESSIFKIPETSKTEILTYYGIKDEEDEFYGLYKKYNFEGLSFEELYNF